ncbi:hypothetical protein HB779_21375 (plasmid) [Phyllobacterium sp. 628]|uniref:hypothetical protein n=1 Tax=Phyllobacterium sp. 628 TaxID=2718938 RepID=UPI0016627AE8|nr:hypothetical protein [Phyllobacterium sp. 628]QND54329.1 hypothetical protein HB779_21375 [Phyllobacterium sp. 628]
MTFSLTIIPIIVSPFWSSGHSRSVDLDPVASDLATLGSCHNRNHPIPEPQSTPAESVAEPTTCSNDGWSTRPE